MWAKNKPRERRFWGLFGLAERLGEMEKTAASFFDLGQTQMRDFVETYTDVASGVFTHALAHEDRHAG